MDGVCLCALIVFVATWLKKEYNLQSSSVIYIVHVNRLPSDPVVAELFGTQSSAKFEHDTLCTSFSLLNCLDVL